MRIFCPFILFLSHRHHPRMRMIQYSELSQLTRSFAANWMPRFRGA